MFWKDRGLLTSSTLSLPGFLVSHANDEFRSSIAVLDFASELHAHFCVVRRPEPSGHGVTHREQIGGIVEGFELF